MSVITRKNIELLRQYILSDDSRVKNELIESIPADLREKVVIIQEEFEKNTDSKSIALKVDASDFEQEIEEIQSIYNLKKRDLDDQEFETNIIAAITPIERESLKKKLMAFEKNGGEELSDHEIKYAITSIERESLKERFQKLDDSSEEGGMPIDPIEMPAAASSRMPLFHSILKYAVAACFIVATGIGIFLFTRKEVIPENTVASSSEKEPIDQNPTNLPLIETVPLAEVSITSNSYTVLKSGLGYGEVEEKVTIVVNDQKESVLSIQKAISTYSNQLEKVTEIQNPEAELVAAELSDRIDALQTELSQIHIKENQYVFDGKVLTLFVTSASNENQIIYYDSNYYLKKNNRFFKLTISEDPQPFMEATDPNVLKALDKIIFNAD
ncbi:hypothetical protein [Cyclobacterium salsum]|uniref:hypothetical protein n=1 Tax=Cyclobacterium salsum TaxID=2666329 RepID=UPI001391F4D4|nr:hypothetical protein [Cyclobacterium salsum]